MTSREHFDLCVLRHARSIPNIWSNYDWLDCESVRDIYYYYVNRPTEPAAWRYVDKLLLHSIKEKYADQIEAAKKSEKRKVTCLDDVWEIFRDKSTLIELLKTEVELQYAIKKSVSFHNEDIDNFH